MWCPGFTLIGGLVITSALSAQEPKVAVDPRVELFAIVFKLAGAPEYNQNRFTPYIADIQQHFASQQNHAAIGRVRTVRQASSLNFDAVMSLAVHVSEPPELRPLVRFDTVDGSRWRTPDAGALIDDLRAFVADSRAMDFFANHRTLYDSASTRLGRRVAESLDATWFARFFGTPADRDFVVVPLLANSGTNFAPCAELTGARRTCYAIIGHVAHDSAGFPSYDTDVASTLVHEFTHGYANPAIDTRMADFNRASTLVFPTAAAALREQGYGSGESMMYETLVRAVVAQYLRERQGTEVEGTYLNQQRALGWLWVPEIAERLEQYAADRREFPTMTSFLPRIVAYFDSLPARVSAIQHSYDATRPTVGALSIDNGSQTIDPRMSRIVIHFDQPMQPTQGDIRPVSGRERLPEITARGFDSTRIIFTLDVKLEPDHEYDFVLNRASGGRFMNTAGVPLAPYRIRFKTRTATP